MKSAFRLGAFHAVLWMATYVGVGWAFEGSPANAAYASLCAWWVTLYAALLFETSWRSIPMFVGVLATALIASTMAHVNVVYHDIPPLASFEFARVAALLVVLWVSPLIVNRLVLTVWKSMIRS